MENMNMGKGNKQEELVKQSEVEEIRTERDNTKKVVETMNKLNKELRPELKTEKFTDADVQEDLNKLKENQDLEENLTILEQETSKIQNDKNEIENIDKEKFSAFEKEQERQKKEQVEDRVRRDEYSEGQHGAEEIHQETIIKEEPKKGFLGKALGRIKKLFAERGDDDNDKRLKKNN